MIFISLYLMVLSCLIIWRASDGFESAANYLGRHLTDGVKGATINAIGSSMPELLTTLFFLFVLFDKDGFAGGLGTTAGSALFNGLIIPAMVILAVLFKGVARSVHVSRKVILRDGIALILAEFCLILILGDNWIGWQHGLILMAIYVVYAVFMLSTMSKTKGEEDQHHHDDQEQQQNDRPSSWLKNILTLNLEPVVIRQEFSNTRAWILLSLAITVIGFACFLLVKSTEWLGEALNLPIYFIAVILASAATSVPDTILSIKDARNGNYDDAVSNALGSNIFDICFALGFPLFLFSLIYGPISISAETLINIQELRILLLIFTLLAFLIYVFKTTMTAFNAWLLLAIYGLFASYILAKAVDADFAIVISQSIDSINMVIEYVRFWK